MEDAIKTAAEVIEADALPRLHEVHTDPNTKCASEQDLRKSIADKPVKQKRLPAKVDDADRDLWGALKACRKELADAQGVPPFHIFHDATLMEMMQYRPKDNDDLLTINGIGVVKLEKYGDEFLTVLADF